VENGSASHNWKDMRTNVNALPGVQTDDTLPHVHETRVCGFGKVDTMCNVVTDQ